MKFAKLLDRTKALSPEGYQAHYIAYKELKKLLAEVHAALPEGVTEPDEVVRALAKDDNEVGFFSRLRHEVVKIATFYSAEQARLQAVFDRLAATDYAILERSVGPVAEDAAQAMGGRISDFYLELLMLENYAVMNYCGFGKILKKHDKRTHFVTKRKFMRHHVDKEEFATYPRLLAMLDRTESAYQSLVRLVPERVRIALAASAHEQRRRELSAVKDDPSADGDGSDTDDDSDPAVRAPHDASDAAAAAAAASGGGGGVPRSRSELDIAAAILGVSGDVRLGDVSASASSSSSSTSSSSSSTSSAASASASGSPTAGARAPAVQLQGPARTATLVLLPYSSSSAPFSVPGVSATPILPPHTAAHGNPFFHTRAATTMHQ